MTVSHNFNCEKQQHVKPLEIISENTVSPSNNQIQSSSLRIDSFGLIGNGYTLTCPGGFGLKVTAVEVMVRSSHQKQNNLSLHKSGYSLMSKSSPWPFHYVSAMTKQCNSFIMD